MSRLRSAAHWAGRRTVFPNTSQDVGRSSLETPRQRLNWDPDIKRLSGIVERRRHRTLYLPECGRNGAFALPVCSLHRVCLRASLEYTLVQTVPQTLRRVERRDVIRSSAQNSVGPATSRPVLAPGPVHKTPFGSRRVERKCGIEVNVTTEKQLCSSYIVSDTVNWVPCQKKVSSGSMQCQSKGCFSEQLHSGQQPSECGAEQLA